MTRRERPGNHVYTRRGVVPGRVQDNAKEASVLVRLDYCSEFNVCGLECAIITENAHGPCHWTGVSTTAVSLYDCREQWRGGVGDGTIDTMNEFLRALQAFQAMVVL